MIRIRYIADPELRAKVEAKIAEWRGFPGGRVPDLFELDDADYVDVLQAIKEDESPNRFDEDDDRD
jgi:hypothetical protein